ncbi:uncharacterized protein LOC127855120 isoform X1 [Dreissena polymorpha]|uniref:uncharacterized protein LOC127855120 isoform X1 n=1 Tax=Dreissena polymorpha TaxID=45954 RepID=UPI00226465D3|nr:uncharacterized protein LOC127855120 isoform X1 [Dreissena polymorpha]
MRCLLILAVAMTAVMAAPHERSIYDQLSHFVSLDVLKQDLQLVLNVLGSDPTEQACEAEWHKLFSQGLVTHAASLVCHSFQALVNHFNLVPSGSAAVGKRFLLDDTLAFLARALGVNTTYLSQKTSEIIAAVGSEPTEALCEQEAHKVFAGTLIDHGVPLFCRSFQKLVLQLGLNHPVPARRTAMLSINYYMFHL